MKNACVSWDLKIRFSSVHNSENCLKDIVESISRVWFQVVSDVFASSITSLLILWWMQNICKIAVTKAKKHPMPGLEFTFFTDLLHAASRKQFSENWIIKIISLFLFCFKPYIINHSYTHLNCQQEKVTKPMLALTCCRIDSLESRKLEDNFSDEMIAKNYERKRFLYLHLQLNFKGCQKNSSTNPAEGIRFAWQCKLRNERSWFNGELFVNHIHRKYLKICMIAKFLPLLFVSAFQSLLFEIINQCLWQLQAQK